MSKSVELAALLGFSQIVIMLMMQKCALKEEVFHWATRRVRA